MNQFLKKLLVQVQVISSWHKLIQSCSRNSCAVTKHCKIHMAGDKLQGLYVEYILLAHSAKWENFPKSARPLLNLKKKKNPLSTCAPGSHLQCVTIPDAV